MKTRGNCAASHKAKHNRLKVKILFFTHIKVTKACLLILAFYLLGGTSFGQKRIARVSVMSSDNIAAQQKPVTLTASIENRLDEIVTGTLTWNVRSVFFESPPPTAQSISLNGRQIISCKYTLSIPCPSFADIECRFEAPKSKNPITAKYRIGSDVEGISSPLTRQVDFFDFWEQSLAELAEVPPAFQMTPRPNKARTEVQLHEVSMESFGGVSVRGWLETPKKAGVFPAVLRLPGYGQAMKPVGDQENLIVFSFNPRGHGNSQDDVPGTPQDYWVRGLDDRDTYFYRGAYLDCIRAVSFLCSLNNVDQERIAVWGASQGGGFAFATAALDNRVDLCVADIPFLCNWTNYFKLTQWDEMDKWLDQKQHRSWSQALKTMSYFDTMNLCERVTCPTIMSIGLQDQICPPTTSFAAFNRIRGTKDLYDLSVTWPWPWQRSSTAHVETNQRTIHSSGRKPVGHSCRSTQNSSLNQVLWTLEPKL